MRPVDPTDPATQEGALTGGRIAAPYLLYLGDVTEPLAAKTARGIAVWRPDRVMGQHRRSPDAVDLGLPDLSFAEARRRGARTLVLGTANAGGVMGKPMVADVIAALEAGLDVVGGLHERLGEHPRIAGRAQELGRHLVDVRRPPVRLPIGTGRPRPGLRLLTVGTDCAVGKMYTALAIERELRARGHRTDFRATGQTGILIAGEGMPVDAVLADFISGAVEQLSPVRDDGGWDIIEGQGSLFHPSFAGVSLGLLHGAQPDALALCHESGRRKMRHVLGRPLPDLHDCLERNLEAARLTNPHVVAVGISLNTSALSEEERSRACREVEAQHSLPCQDPVVDGVGRIVDRLLDRFPG